MLDVAQNFEQVAVRFNPLVLIGPALAALSIGLFVWLGGLGIRRLLHALAGAIVGCTFGSFIIGRNTTAALALAAIGAIIAIIFERIFITILTATLAAAIAFAVLARPYTGKTQQPPPNQLQMTKLHDHFTVQQTLKTIKAYASDFSAQIKKICSQMPTYNWLIIVALAAISILAGFSFWRLTSALCWATLGAILIFAGMISLLLFKGSSPITAIYSRTPFYTAVFAAMIAFGTIIQLLLCQYPNKFRKRKKQPDEHKNEPEETPLSWRNR